MPVSRSHAVTRLLGACAGLALCAQLAAEPAMAQQMTSDEVWETIAANIERRHQRLHAAEREMLRAPSMALEIAKATAQKYPDLHVPLQELASAITRKYMAGRLRSYRSAYPLAADGSIAAPRTPTSEILFGVGSIAAFGVALAYMSREERPDYPDGWLPGDHDEQGAKKRRKNGSASNLGSEASESATVRRVGVETAHRLGYTGEGIMLAAIDSGVDSRHHEVHHSLREDLSWNYVSRSHDIDDYNGHGTHVHALLVGRKDGYGMYGMAPDAQSMSFNLIQPGDETGRTRSFSLRYTADAFERALDGGADVINNSWGIRTNAQNYTLAELRRNGVLTSSFEAQLDRLIQDDVIVAWAAGNDRFSSPDVHAALPSFRADLEGHWVAVVSVDENDNLSSFSNRCGIAQNYCLAAPGERVLSAYSMDGKDGDTAPEYAWMSGTSMASPIVAGGAALMKQAFPELTAPEILQILFDSATDLGAAGVDEVYGHGLMNLDAALSPKGPLLLVSGDTVQGEAHEAGNSRVALGGGIGIALASASGTHSMSVVDDYGRGYEVPISPFIASVPSEMTKAGFGEEPETGVQLSSGPTEDPFGLAHLGSAGLEFNLQSHVPLAGGAFQVGLASGDHGQAVTLGVQQSAGRASLEVEIGRLVENGAVLGGVSQGAFSGGSSQTDLLRIASAWNLGGDTDLRWAASFGETDFQQGALAVTGDGVRTNALALGLETASLWAEGDRFSVLAALPLAAVSGEVSITTPAGREASQGGAKSDEVTHATASFELQQAARPVDLGMAYERPVGMGDEARVGVSAGWRPEEGRAELGMRFSIDF